MSDVSKHIGVNIFYDIKTGRTVFYYLQILNPDNMLRNIRRVRTNQSIVTKIAAVRKIRELKNMIISQMVEAVITIGLN